MSVSSYPVPALLLLAVLSPQTQAADTDKDGNCRYCPDITGWTGWVEGGLGYQSDDDSHFGRYTGYDEEGFLLNGGADVRYRDEDGTFLDGRAEDLGLESRRIRLQGGRQGQFQLGVEYDQIPNYREESAYSPYRDQGNGRLDLPADWVPGATTADMPSLGGDLKRTPLKTERDRTGASFSYLPSRRWELSGFARHEEKEGTKDLGATFGFSQTVILPVPFKYETDDFGVNLGYTGDKFQAQLSYTASMFKSEEAATLWRNPFEDAASDTAWGRMAEAPDNEFHQISAILGYQLLPSTRIGARFARGRMTQDDDFLPYTINPAITTSTLPATSLDGKVDTTLASLEVNSQPLQQLRLDGSYTYSDRDNKSSVNVYDYVVTDTALDGERMNRPYSYEQRLLRLKAAYRFPKNVNLSVGYDDDQMDRTYTSVEETHDKTWWTQLKLQPLDRLETSIKYSNSERDASSFTPLAEIDPLLDNPNDNFYNNPLMRAFHMADRSRDKLGFGLFYSPLDSLSLGLDLDYYKDEYDEMYLGLQEAKGLTYTTSLSYSFSEDLSASAFYTYDKLSSEQQGSEKLLIDDPDNLWIASDENLTHSVGLGINWAMIPETFDLGADIAYAKFTGKFEFADSTDLPEISSTLTLFTLKGTYQMTENLSLRGEYRYEKYKEEDWAKDGVVNTLPSLLSLGTAPQDNSTSLGLVSLRYAF